MQMTDAFGNKIFETIQITLVRTLHAHLSPPPLAYTTPRVAQVCDECLKTDGTLALETLQKESLH